MDSCCNPGLAPTAPLDFILLLTTGFTVSLGHCVGMCGPIVSAFGLARRPEERSLKRRLPPLLRYNTGRVASYIAIGAMFALVGSAARFMGTTRLLQAVLSIAAGAIMLPLALGLTGLLPTARWVEGGGVGLRATRWIRGLIRAEGWTGQFGLGLANGFLPCGPVIAVALSAAASSRISDGAISMGVYGLGTIPAMTALGLGAGWLSPKARAAIYKVGGALVIAIALQLILRGLAAVDLVPHLRFGEVVIW